MYKDNMIYKCSFIFLLLLALWTPYLHAQSLTSSDIIKGFSVKGSSLLLKTSTGQYNFHDLVNEETIVQQKNERILYIGYNHFASRTKSFELAELGINKGKLLLLRIDSYSYDNLGQRSFGCSTLFNLHNETNVVNIDSIETYGSICSNYDFIEGKNIVRIYTKRNSIDIPVVSNNSTKAMFPVFYSDGTQIGWDLITKIQDPSDVLFIDIQKNIVFRSIDVSGKTVAQRNDIGFFLERTGKYQEAVKILTEVIEIAPNRTPAYLNIGDAYSGLGELLKAKKNYKIYISRMKSEGKEEKIPERVKKAVIE